MRLPLKTLLAVLLLSLFGCSEPSVWVPGWQETSSLAEARVGPAVVEANGYIYMIGGFDSKDFLKTTEYSKIQKDGSLGPWEYGPAGS